MIWETCAHCGQRYPDVVAFHRRPDGEWCEGEITALRALSARLAASETRVRDLEIKLGKAEMELLHRRKDAREHDCRAALLDRTPEGTELAYLHGNQVIVTGTPPDAEDDESGHNCDEMGCGTFSHVVKRLRVVDAALASTPSPATDGERATTAGVTKTLADALIRLTAQYEGDFDGDAIVRPQWLRDALEVADRYATDGEGGGDGELRREDAKRKPGAADGGGES